MVKLEETYNRSTELRHFLYRMLAVCALLLRFQSYVITFLGITANGWCYEQVCLAGMSKLPKMLLANLLIARVIRWHGLLNDKLKLKHETKFLLK